MHSLEVWSDSFKEGEWFVEDLLLSNYTIASKSHRYNFQPIYSLEHKQLDLPLNISVFGDYGCWTPQCREVEELISIGKPDVVVYDPVSKRVVLAIEETAAVPTGNQALQRLERVWWAAESQIPFIYLLGEYGLHIDGGTRRNSIWPSYLAIKLSMQYRIPSLTLMYGSPEHPNSYETGLGLGHLRNYIDIAIKKHFSVGYQQEEEKALLISIYGEMGRFVSEHADEITSYLPGKQELKEKEVIEKIAERIASKFVGADK